MRTSTSSWAWLWILLAILGVAGGGIYYYKARGFAPGPAVADPTPDSIMRRDTFPRTDTTAAQAPVVARDSARVPRGAAQVDSATASPPTDSASTVPVPPDVVGPVDSGAIRLIGLPRGSTVMLDEQPVTQALTRLPPGPHALAISAPKYNFYSDTVIVRPGQTQELTPQLVPIGAPVPTRPAERRAVPGCVPGPGYNADGSCFEERPKPVNPPFVTVPPDAGPSPRPSLLWVKVSTEGRTVDIMRLRPSNDPAFERAVRNFVWTVTWHPALKNGAPAEAWTQMLFPPALNQ